MRENASPPSIAAPRERARSRGVDHSDMRAANMGLILRRLRQGSASRAQLAASTRLSKAAVTSLSTELAERGLVREGDVDRHGAVGRPGTHLTLDGRHVGAVGVEISVDYLSLSVLDLTGRALEERVVGIDVARMDRAAVLGRVADLAKEGITALTDSGRHVCALALSAPGVIDPDRGEVRFASNLGWRDVPLRDELAARLGPDAPSLFVENDAKLAAVAEYAIHEADGVHDLVYLSGDVGVGAGIISGGRLVPGWSGFSGEVGHLPLDPRNRPCRCGRTGCWENSVGLQALVDLVGGGRPGFQPVDQIVSTVRARAVDQDQQVLAGLAQLAEDLSRGVGIVVDILNPRVVVLGGYFSYLGDFLVPHLTRALQARELDEGARARIVLARLGVNAAARGAAMTALDTVFTDPSRVPSPA